MAIKATKKEIMESWFCVSVPYCDAEELLTFAPKIAYTCGVYGWNASVYLVDGRAVVTGYRPFGDVRADRERLEAYEEKARAAKRGENARENVERLAVEWLREEVHAWNAKKYPEAYAAAGQEVK